MYSQVRLFKNTLLPLLLICNLANAADPVMDDDIGNNRTQRIKAYFANIPKFEFPCGELELYSKPELLLVVPLEDRVKFEKIRSRGGDYDQAREALETRRTALKQAYESRLQAALDAYLVMREISEQYDSAIIDAAAEEQMRIVSEQVENQNFAFYVTAYRFYSAGIEVMDLAKSYYDIAAKAFAALELEEQMGLLDQLYARLVCLREERNKAYRDLMESTIALEQGLENYLSAEFNAQEKGKIDPMPIDQINQQLKRTALQIRYKWLVHEFSAQATIYRKVLWAHDKKLRNSELYPLMQLAQEMQPGILPRQAFPQDSRRTQLREQIARVRARIGYVTLLEDEAKTEAVYTVNTNPVEQLGRLYDDAKNKIITSAELAEWVNANGNNFADMNRGGFMELAMIKQFAGSAIDQLIMTP